MKQKISIITVVKNGMPHLKDCIKSFKNQSYSAKELIIVYSKSNDGTEKYINKLSGNIKIFKDEKYKNKFGPLNIGIKKATGNIIGLLHSDDFYPNNNTLTNIMRSFDTFKCDVLYGNILFCKKNNKRKFVRKWISRPFEKKDLKMGWMPPHTSIYAKKNILLKNPYSIKFPISADYKFILDLFSKKLKFYFLNKYLCIMRAGGDSTKIENFAKKIIEDIKISRKFFKHYMICILLKVLRKIEQFF